MTWAEQMKSMNHAISYGASPTRAVAIVNSNLTECPIKPRRLGFLWRPKRHRYEDYTSALNTVTYSTLDRCKDCGFLVLGSGI